jgi:hypothetical protein
VRVATLPRRLVGALWVHLDVWWVPVSYCSGREGYQWGSLYGLDPAKAPTNQRTQLGFVSRSWQETVLKAATLSRRARAISSRAGRRPAM